jgi:glycosyltransferase involved in cell wall biosynthesis
VPKRRLALIKSGLFSYINTSVHAQLVAHFPELEVEEVDVWRDLVRQHPSSYWIALAQAAVLYPGKLLIHRHALALVALRTPYLFHRMRRLINERIRERLGEYEFTFQTQSIFDGSTEGVPHFVFTDHAHLANLRYPAFRREDLFPEPWRSLEPEIYKHARHIFAMSDHVRASICEDYGIPGSRVTTVYGGSNVASSSAPMENDNYRNQTVVFVGGDWKRKGGPVLLQAFARLRASVPGARLIVVGCQPNVGQPWCEEVGKVAPEEVARHLLRSSVFVLPTRIEPFGIAPIEALSHRLPAVVSNVGAMPTLVRHGESGFVVPSDDPEALANALQDLLCDSEKCRRFGEAGYQDMTARYTWPVVGQKLHEGIVEALSRSREA